MMTASVWELLPVLFLALIASIHGDPNNLVLNGDFEIELFVFEAFTQMDVSHDGEMDFLPFFNVVRGGVQVLDAQEYGGNQGQFVVHMNYEKGPGVLHSAPLITPRKGATYNFSFNVADNPDGGPLYKAVMVRILVNNRLSSPKVKPFNVSAPHSTRAAIAWESFYFTFVGTGEATTLQFESLVPGPFGVLIDNVQVTLLSLVENGSFENYSDELVRSNITFFNVLASPSYIISGWTVTTGKIKLSGNERWQSSTDETDFMLDLNAELSAGTISSLPFTTKPGKKYKLLYDTAANPDNMPPISGHILASVISKPGGALLASRSVFVSGEGFTPASMGWLTYVVEFEARETMTIVEFTSQMIGSTNGPMLDNVLVYEVCKPAHYKSLGPTFNAGTALKPSVWTSILACALAICFSRHFSEMQSLYR